MLSEEDHRPTLLAASSNGSSGDHFFADALLRFQTPPRGDHTDGPDQQGQAPMPLRALQVPQRAKSPPEQRRSRQQGRYARPSSAQAASTLALADKDDLHNKKCEYIF